MPGKNFRDTIITKLTPQKSSHSLLSRKTTETWISTEFTWKIHVRRRQKLVTSIEGILLFFEAIKCFNQPKNRASIIVPMLINNKEKRSVVSKKNVKILGSFLEGAKLQRKILSLKPYQRSTWLYERLGVRLNCIYNQNLAKCWTKKTMCKNYV